MFELGILGWILVGLIVGWLASIITGNREQGILADIVVGILGAFVGGFLFSLVGIEATTGLIGSLLVALVGAIVVLWIKNVVTR